MTSIEAGAMRRAVALSALGLGTTSPNPPVGCVLLERGGRIVGEGYHERKGEAHAEAQALAAAGALAAGATALVTLEPCNHHGRTPPCHQALLDAGVARVVIALVDPTSRGQGGAARLREAGVDVEVGVLATEAALVLGPWMTALRGGRPRVTWAYELGPVGLGVLQGDFVSEALAGFDAVLDGDGRLHEGPSGAHGAGVFRLPRVGVSSGVDTVLAALYEAGTRSLLLHGGPTTAAPFLAADVLDEVVVYVHELSASGRPTSSLDWPLTPPGFRLERVRPVNGAIRVDATRDPDRQENGQGQAGTSTTEP